MAKIPIILEPGRADGKLSFSSSIFDENKNKFQNKINEEVEERLNDVKDTLNSDSTTTPLSAKQGKVLKELLDTKVIEVGAIPIDSEPIEGNITHIVNSDGLAKEFNKCNTTIITTERIEDSAVTSEKIATSAFDSTLSVSGKIAPADVVGKKITDLDLEINGVITEIHREEINGLGNGYQNYLFNSVMPIGSRITNLSRLVTGYLKVKGGSYDAEAKLSDIINNLPYITTKEYDGIAGNFTGELVVTWDGTDGKKGLVSAIGDLTKLKTENKNSIVDALNELSENQSDNVNKEEFDSLKEEVTTINSTIEEELFKDGSKEVTETYTMLGEFQRTPLNAVIPAGTRIYNFSGRGSTSFYFWDSANKYITPIINAQTTEYILSKDAYSVGNKAGGDVTFSYIKVDGKVSRIGEIDTKISKTVEELVFLSNTTQETKEKVESLISNVEIVCPDMMYAVVGNEFNIYYDSLFGAMDSGLTSPFGYYVDVRCTTLWKVGIRHDRMWQIAEGALTTTHIGNHIVNIVVYNSANKIVAEKSVMLKVVNNSAIPSGKTILLLGDSLTNNGRIPQYVSENFVANGGIAPILVGSREKWGYKHEGWPGYSTHDFTSNTGRNYYIFQVPTSFSIAVNDQYSCQGNVYKVEDLREETDTTQSVRTSLVSGSASIPTSGTITWVSGSQASAKSADYTDFEIQDANPLWDATTNKVNITTYRNKLGIASQLDAVVIMLGVNDALVGYIDGAEHLKTIVDAILVDSPNCKIIVQIPTEDANTISSWHAYQDVTYSKKMRYKSFMWKIKKAICDAFKNYNANVYVGQACHGIDRYYGYPKQSVSVGKRITETEILHTNSVHPSDEGYHQLADSYYLQLRGIL